MGGQGPSNGRTGPEGACNGVGGGVRIGKGLGRTLGPGTGQAGAGQWRGKGVGTVWMTRMTMFPCPPHPGPQLLPLPAHSAGEGGCRGGGRYGADVGPC